MKRRALLASLGLGVTAGCARWLQMDAGEQATPDGEGATDRRRVTLGESDAVPASAGVAIDIEQPSSTVAPDEIPRFEVTTTNLNRRKHISVKPGHECCLFNRDEAASSPSGLWFFHGAVGVGRDRGERWSATGGFEDYGCTPRHYDAEERLTNEYRTWDDARTDGYMVPGRYRFEADVRVTGPADESRTAEFAWGSTVHVEPA